MKLFREPIKFEWDKGNQNKNLLKHQVTDEECEEIFFDPFKRVLKDIIHSKRETRYLLIGQSKKQKVLFVVFTLRRDKIRIISARRLNRKESNLYEKRT